MSVSTVDIHRHFFPQTFLDAARTPRNGFGMTCDGQVLTLRPGQSMRLKKSMFDEDWLIEEMDARRLDVVALSLMPPAFRYDLPGETARDLAATVNQGLVELCNRHIGRLVPMIHVPLQDVSAAIDEISRPGVVAAQIGSHVEGTNLDAPHLRPFFETAAAKDILLFIHPSVSAVIGAERLARYHLRNLIGNVTETAVAIASLLFGGVLDACPNLRVCLAHGGGSAPFIAGRWAHGQRVREDVRANTATPVHELLRRVYFDSLTHDKAALRFLIDMIGAGKILLGSDGQADMGESRPVERVEALDLSDADRQCILGGNAAVLLKLPPQSE